MTCKSLNSAWKIKIEPNNIFDNEFLNEKDLALQPIHFLFESNNLESNDNLKNKKLSLNNIKIEKIRKKSLTDSNIYNSNIIIIQSVTDEDSEPTSLNPIDREIEKIKKLISKKKAKNKTKSKKK